MCLLNPSARIQKKIIEKQCHPRNPRQENETQRTYSENHRMRVQGPQHIGFRLSRNRLPEFLSHRVNKVRPPVRKGKKDPGLLRQPTGRRLYGRHHRRRQSNPRAQICQRPSPSP